MKPKYMTAERMALGIERLLSAPKDLALSGASVIESSPPLKSAPDAHRKLYARYRKDLKRVLDDAVAWWNDRTVVFKEEYGDTKQARMANWQEFPAGPVSDPYTVAVIRKYWLACDALNAQAPTKVAPEVLLLQWVIDDGDMVTAELLSAMPYWPMGLDSDGAWT
ncbi:MAG TPA: hypothetical protein VGE16_05210 [Albitalea sp.]